MREALLANLWPLAILGAFALLFFGRWLQLYLSHAFRQRSRLDQEMLAKGESLFLGQAPRQAFVRTMEPLFKVLEGQRINPNALTVGCLAVSVLAGGLIALGELAWGGVVGLAGSSLDYLDGRLARRTGRTSKAGAFLDSTLDRYCDIAFLSGAALFFRHWPWVLFACLLGLGSSLAISYTRAKAESLGAELKVGLMQRPERVVLFCLGAVASPLVEPLLLAEGLVGSAWGGRQLVFASALWLLAALATITAAQRTVAGFRGLQRLGEPANPSENAAPPETAGTADGPAPSAPGAG